MSDEVDTCCKCGYFNEVTNHTVNGQHMKTITCTHCYNGEDKETP